MRYWLFMFRPDTYEIVKERCLVGVRDGVRKRFREVSQGDRFVAYISRKKLIDAYGTLTSDVFEDESNVFASDQVYRHRATVEFETVDAALPVNDVLWGLTPFEDLGTTTPANIIFCKGGFIEINRTDFEALRDWIDAGDGASPWGA